MPRVPASPPLGSVTVSLYFLPVDACRLGRPRLEARLAEADCSAAPASLSLLLMVSVSLAPRSGDEIDGVTRKAPT